MITICLTYFRSLTLANLSAALYSIRRQDFSRVAAIVVIDNATDDPRDAIDGMVAEQDFTVPVVVRSFKHGDQSRTHAWSTNAAVREAATPWVFFTRADYLLDFSAVAKFAAIVDAQPAGWSGFVTSNGRHMHCDVAACEGMGWRTTGAGVLGGIDFEYTCIDAGVWMARRDVFDRVGGLNERLSSWGHAQTLFQYKLHAAGAECIRIRETLFFHPAHAAERDLTEAHRQLAAEGVDVRDLWSRHDGAKPY
jgi:GT2 family glycosyltransferase